MKLRPFTSRSSAKLSAALIVAIIAATLCAPLVSDAQSRAASLTSGWLTPWSWMASVISSQRNDDEATIQARLTAAVPGAVHVYDPGLILGFAAFGEQGMSAPTKDSSQKTAVGPNGNPIAIEAPAESDRVADPTPAPVTAIPTPPPPPTELFPDLGVLRIPSISVAAPIEMIGIDTKGNVGVPKNARDVGWFSGGPRPGEKGNVVIDGHLDTQSGQAAVFYRLKQVRPGDVIQFDRSIGQLDYVIDRIQSIGLGDAAAAQSLFAPTDRQQLVLITCAGKWNQASKTYSDRLVVFAHLQ